jgi:hypothetical protein
MKKFFIAILLIASACTKDLERKPQPEAIVEAYLLPRKQVSIRISREVQLGAADTLLPLEGLSPILVQNHTSHLLTFMGNGLYGNPDISLQEKDSCHLYFQYNGKEVSAHTVIPGKPTGFTCNTDTLIVINWERTIPEVLEFKWNNPGNDYHMVFTQFENGPPWWILPINAPMWWPYSLMTTPTKETIARITTSTFFYDEQRYQMMLFRILPEYTLLFNQNNNNSPNLTNPAGNIINGYGIFTGISYSDTIMLPVLYK